MNSDDRPMRASHPTGGTKKSAASASIMTPKRIANHVGELVQNDEEA